MTTDPTADERAAIEFAQQLRFHEAGLWRIVHDNGYRSVEMEREVAEREARLWPRPDGKPYRAEPVPRPTLSLQPPPQPGTVTVPRDCLRSVVRLLRRGALLTSTPAEAEAFQHLAAAVGDPHPTEGVQP